MFVTELKGRPQVFTLKDGSTLRVFSRKTAEVAESNISNEIKIAESKGLILLTTPEVKKVVEEVVEAEAPAKISKNKSGGTK